MKLSNRYESIFKLPINNLGYPFSTNLWGNGLTTEFAIYAVSYECNELKLPDISATVRSNLLTSQKVQTNLGLRYVRDIHDVKNSPASMLFTLTHASLEGNAR